MICKHDRIKEQCEDCRFIEALERGEPTAVLAATATGERTQAPRNMAVERDQDVVEVDSHILRTDLDADTGSEGAYTLVRAGETVPDRLRGFDRRPAPERSPDAAEPASDASATSGTGKRRSSAG